jgi:hypothetical protein
LQPVNLFCELPAAGRTNRAYIRWLGIALNILVAVKIPFAQAPTAAFRKKIRLDHRIQQMLAHYISFSLLGLVMSIAKERKICLTSDGCWIFTNIG